MSEQQDFVQSIFNALLHEDLLKTEVLKDAILNLEDKDLKSLVTNFKTIAANCPKVLHLIENLRAV